MTATPALPRQTPALLAPSDGVALLDACHQQTLVTLGKLSVLMAHLDAHGSDADAQALARDIVAFFDRTGRQHHEEEERHVFPRLLASSDPEMVRAIQRLQQDHGWLEADWNEIGPQIDAVAGGQGWVDLDILREGVEIFVALSQEHMALEESLIYPSLRAQLATPERIDMGREMLARRRRDLRAAVNAAPA